MRNHVPKLCRHKGKGLGYATINGKPVYFGKWPANHKRPPHAVQAAYDAAIAALLTSRSTPQPAQKPIKHASVGEVWELYWAHATGYYLKGGKPTSELHCLKSAGRVLARLYGEADAAKFTLWDLEAVQKEFVRLGWARETVNEQVGRVRRVFKWAAYRQLVPEEVAHNLLLLHALKEDRTTAPEMPPVEPVPRDLFEKALPLCRPLLRAVLRSQYLLGCRPQDVTPIRPGELDRSGPVWLYRPGTWKTRHHKKAARLVYWVGPQAQATIAPYLDQCRTDEDYVFHTRHAPKHHQGRAGCYSTGSYRVALLRVLRRHGLPEFSPNQIRHLRLSEISHQYGVEMAQTVAMHSELSTTEIYATRNLQKSREIMAAIG